MKIVIRRHLKFGFGRSKNKTDLGHDISVIPPVIFLMKKGFHLHLKGIRFTNTLSAYICDIICENPAYGEATSVFLDQPLTI